MRVMNPKSLANLAKRKPFQKGNVPKSPGRPPIADLRADILSDYKRNGKAYVTSLRKRKPEVYAAYGFGKPAETVNIGGIPDQPLVIERVEALTIPQLKARLAALKAKAQTPEANG